VTDLPPAEVAAMLGQKQDADGVLYGSEEDEPPYQAIGFRAKKPGGKYKYIWLYKVKFKIPDESYNTKKDGIEFDTPEIVGDFFKRHDGLWKADYTGLPTDAAAETWFQSVREPREEESEPETNEEPGA
jgi:phi13 family phage major tail protein